MVSVRESEMNVVIYNGLDGDGRGFRGPYALEWMANIPLRMILSVCRSRGKRYPEGRLTCK